MGTDIAYSVEVEDASAVTVVERLAQPSVMAQALSAATGTVVSEEDVVTVAQPVVSDKPDFQPSGESGQDQDSKAIIDTMILMICAIAVTTCCCVVALFRACKKCHRRQQVKWASGHTDKELDGVWIVEQEQHPDRSRPFQQHGKATSRRQNAAPDAIELAAAAPGAWCDDRFDMIEDPNEGASESVKDGEEGEPPPMMPSRSAGRIHFQQRRSLE